MAAYVGLSIYAKSVAGATGDAGPSGTRGFIGWTPDPNRTNPNQGDAHTAVTTPVAGNPVPMKDVGTPQAQPLIDATL